MYALLVKIGAKNREEKRTISSFPFSCKAFVPAFLKGELISLKA
jgi:hypothetical protein